MAIGVSEIAAASDRELVELGFPAALAPDALLARFLYRCRVRPDHTTDSTPAAASRAQIA